MSTSDKRALVTEIEDRLIDLYVRQNEAAADRDKAHELQVEIDQARAQREEIRRCS